MLLILTKKSYYAFITMISFLGLCSMFIEELNLFSIIHNHENDNNNNIDSNDTPMFVLENRIKSESSTIDYDDPPTSSSSSSSSSNYAPVIIGAGQGTTGTHLFFKVTCLLGYPSFHFRLGCLPQESTITITTDEEKKIDDDDDGDDVFYGRRRHPTTTTKASSSSSSSSSSQQTQTLLTIDNNKYEKLVRTHISIVKTYKDYASFDNDAIEFKTKLVTQLESLIVQAKSLNITLALHDSPYPMLMPSLLKIVKKHYNNNKPPMILLSERNPIKFVERRISQHGSQLICIDKNTSTIINPHTLVGGAFDMITCIENGLQQQHIMNETTTAAATATATAITQFLGRIGDMAEMDGGVRRPVIAKQFEQYQNAIRNHRATIFSYDMFIQPNRTQPKDLAKIIIDETTILGLSGNFYPPGGTMMKNVSNNIIDLYKMEYK